jgi:RNA polymerase sigma factor (TIGR02999 family)
VDFHKIGHPMSDVTLVLEAVRRGEKQASEELLPMVYEELRRMAAARMARESAGHTLQPTALVHEAWVRLIENGSRTWENRAHFFGAASEAMRRILIERARRKSRLRHGGGQERLNLAELDVAETLPDDKILLVDEALERLKEEDPETARVVVLKFFGGLTNEEIVQILGTSERTVRRQWNYAKAWLFNWIRKRQ